MIDGLLLVAANRVDQVDQLAGEHAGGVGGEQVARLVHGSGGRFIVPHRGIELTRLGVDTVGVDGSQQVADDVGQLDAAGLLLDAAPARRRRVAG